MYFPCSRDSYDGHDSGDGSDSRDSPDSTQLDSHPIPLTQLAALTHTRSAL
ncbi:hypothetical protein [Vibrio parahaemolyticus]|uniref:hypothetical protein n=1 Tax=Vibrio parahaemolyticus TaxID=670 RepID=UPI0023627EEB|nr:hypothetical protein [Vibrio parahaemolyticus]